MIADDDTESKIFNFVAESLQYQQSNPKQLSVFVFGIRRQIYVTCEAHKVKERYRAPYEKF